MTKSLRHLPYPFSAIVGQEDMKLALLLNAVDPRIGGVLIRGHRGTAKSTAARAFASLLPMIEVIEGCAFNCEPAGNAAHCPACSEKLAASVPLARAKRRVPFATLPLGASEDRVIGSIDIEHAIRKGERRFEPGLIAKAHRGIFYVDEVNLLDDHLVDLLLDVAAAGVSTVEREGVSFSHPASFILVGTMNPEEGELRPQLLDRFGLCVEVETESDTAVRTAIVRNRLAYERDPEAILASYLEADRELGLRIEKARLALSSLSCSDAMLDLTARLCVEVGADGHRADIAIVKTAIALAAFEASLSVEESHIHRAAELVLPHRLRKRPQQRNEGRNQDKIKEHLKRHKNPAPPPSDTHNGDEKKKISH